MHMHTHTPQTKAISAGSCYGSDRISECLQNISTLVNLLAELIINSDVIFPSDLEVIAVALQNSTRYSVCVCIKINAYINWKQSLTWTWHWAVCCFDSSQCRLQESAVSRGFNVSLPLQMEGVAMVCDCCTHICFDTYVYNDLYNMPVLWTQVLTQIYIHTRHMYVCIHTHLRISLISSLLAISTNFWWRFQWHPLLWMGPLTGGLFCTHAFSTYINT